jgi:type I restriction enzyme, R subunit
MTNESLHEKQFVEDPFLETLDKLGWEIIKLNGPISKHQQTPNQSFRENFSQILLESKLAEALKKINPFLEQDQVDEVIRRLNTFPSRDLINANQKVLNLLLENTSVVENRKTGEQSPTVRYIDFNKKSNNNFTAISQFKVRIKGTEKHIYPDITLFINGIPLVVIECKSPKEGDPMGSAIDQLLRYSEQRGEQKEGNKELFFFNQFTVATSRNGAKFGTISSNIEKYFFRWTDPYPYKLSDIKESGTPNDQERLIYGMLDKDNLLDLIKIYTIFTEDDLGHTIKLVARYQQFRAVKKIKKQLLDGKNKTEKSGIIWHTQGSGKSLTMMFTVREMYQHPKLQNWKVVFITDRTNLQKQLTKTGDKIGFPINVANKISKLKELVKTNNSDLIMVMIHKFQERDLDEVFPVLNKSPNILVMADEAHRTQYSKLGANFNKALPNAAQIAFTGTPIEKTEKNYGDYIDKYTMKQSVKDGVTLEIVYEGRTNKVNVKNKEEMDNFFADLFSEYNIKERLKILSYGSRKAYLESKPVIENKSKDMIDHYVTQVFPNGFKAQIVAVSREAAVRYKSAIEESLKEKIKELQKNNPHNINIELLKKLKTAVIISKGDQNDEKHFLPFTNEAKQDKEIADFKKSFYVDNDKGKTGILIVNNMLLTGFDAPIEQVMYLDRIMKNHNLLQAIARVNRIGSKDKGVGYVVDYAGTGNHLKEALDNYEEKEQREILESLRNTDDETNELKDKHEKLMKFIKDKGITDFNNLDAFYDLFYDEKIRFDYIQKFKDFSGALNKLYPKKEALNYEKDFRKFSGINVMASQHLRDKKLSMKGIPKKLREVTDKYLTSKGITQKVKPISIIDNNFQKHIDKHKRTRTKAAEVEHAIKDFINEHYEEDPDLYASFSEVLEEIFKQFKDNWEEIYKKLEELRQKIKNKDQENTYGLHKRKQMPFFRIIKNKLFDKKELSEDEIPKLVNLTQLITNIISRELTAPNFWNNPTAISRMRGEIQGLLISSDYNSLPNIFKKRNDIISRIIEIAESNNDLILYSD